MSFSLSGYFKKRTKLTSSFSSRAFVCFNRFEGVGSVECSCSKNEYCSPNRNRWRSPDETFIFVRQKKEDIN